MGSKRRQEGPRFAMKNLRWLMMLCAFLILAACTGEEAAVPTMPAAQSPEQWIKDSLGPGETLVCTKSHEGDYFFVAKPTAKGVKVGSWLDVTDARAKKTSFTYLKEWSFQNEGGESLGSAELPVSIKYVSPTSESPYLGSIDFHPLNLGEAKQIRVAVKVKRCPGTECDRLVKKSEDEKEYSLTLCDVPIAEENEPT
jgi:hypothetical protein